MTMGGRIFLLLMIFFAVGLEAKISEEELKDFLQNVYENEASGMCYKANIVEFDFETDIKNKTKEAVLTNVTLEIAAWEKNLWAKYFKDLVADDFKDPAIKRQVKYLRILGLSALTPEKLQQFTNVSNLLTETYSTAKICPYKKQDCDLKTEGLSLEPGIEGLMAKSTDYDELTYAWKAWRDATGAKMKNLYQEYVALSNEAARVNNFSDKGALWRFSYEDPDFIQNMDDLWNQVEPLYIELHKYVANKLKDRYGNKLDMSDGLIPAHVLGNMWAQSWGNIANLVQPFPNVSKLDVGENFVKQHYTVLDLFKKADEFYQSLGLIPMEMCYNESAGSMINKPTDGREVVCHPSAWDFCDKHTFRIKMCTQINLEDFITIHHEMGHIQYYLLYKDQPYPFRGGANPGFHEAVGDTIALSVSTPTHLQKVNLITNYTNSYENDINSLMLIALEKVAFLPFGLLIDKWRWDVFNGSVPQEKWNSHWWTYRQKYQRVKPPVERSDAIDFDPGAKFHIPGDSQYIAYFLAHVLQFQFYRSLCIAAGQYDPANKTAPLHQCDFYNSKAAGDKLRSGLALGASIHWSETLEVLTGSKQVSAQPLLEYFEPLFQYLKTENQKLAAVSSTQSQPATVQTV